MCYIKQDGRVGVGGLATECTQTTIIPGYATFCEQHFPRNMCKIQLNTTQCS